MTKFPARRYAEKLTVDVDGLAGEEVNVGDAVALLQHLEEVDEESVLDVDAQQGVHLAHVFGAKGLPGFQVNYFPTVGLYKTRNKLKATA